MNESGVQTESLPVMTDAKLKSAFGRISDKYTHDFYKDDTSWAPIQKMMKELKDILPTFSLVESFYDNEMPNKSKIWNFLGVFVTPAGVQRVVPAQIKAHGAGSVEDPLDRFDITFTYTPLSPMNVTDSKRIEMLKSLGVKTKEASVPFALDKIADRLESIGMVKEAHDLDVVSNTIESGNQPSN
jgi:hypothetical protein